MKVRAHKSADKGPNKPIEVHINEEFTIVLGSNPTTGYRWEAKFDREYVELARKEFELNSEAMGGGGKEKFEFIGLRGGETRVELIYKRPWEDKPIKTTSFSIRIR